MPSFIICMPLSQSRGHFAFGNPVCRREIYVPRLANDFTLAPSENPARSLVPCGHPVIEIDGDDPISDSTLEDGFEEAFAGALGIGNGFMTMCA